MFTFIYCLLCIGGSRCHPCHTVYVEVRRQPAEVWLFFLHMGSGIKFRSCNDSKSPYRLISLAGPSSFFLLYLLTFILFEKQFSSFFFSFFFSLFLLRISSYYATLCLDHKPLGIGISLIHLESIRNERNGRRLWSLVLEPHF